MKQIVFIILLLTNVYNFSYGKDIYSLFYEKIKKDDLVFSHFRYLGELHCLDKQNATSIHSFFENEYISLFNEFQILPRLIHKNILDGIYSEFESERRKVYFYDKIEFCYDLYHSAKLLTNYYNLFQKESNYYYKNNDYEISEENVLENITDYLNNGKINRCRFIDCP